MIPFAKVLSNVSFPAIFSLIVVVLVDNSWLLSKNEQRILQKISRRIQWGKRRIRAKGPWKKEKSNTRKMLIKEEQPEAKKAIS